MFVVRSTPNQTSPHELEALGEVLRADVERFSFPRHYIWEPAANRRAAEMLAERFDAMGFRVVIDGRWRNIIALPRASDAPLTLVGAHYDSVPGCPGADDNASALAALLHAASRVGPDANVLFVAFNREEDGLLGSTDLVESGLTRLDLEIRSAHVLEMLGYTADEQRLPPGLPVRAPSDGRFLGLLGKDSSNADIRRLLGAAAGLGLPLIGLQTWFGVDRWFPDLHRSDHSPLWRADVPTLLWTDTANLRNPHYHGPTDTPDTLDYRFLAQVASLLVTAVTPAKGTPKP